MRSDTPESQMMPVFQPKVPEDGGFQEHEIGVSLNGGGMVPPFHTPKNDHF